MKKFKIGNTLISDKSKTYFIADIGANHDGSLLRAKKLIKLCAESGANAAKFQHFAAQSIVSDYGFKSMGSQQSHQSEWKKSVFEVYKDASINIDWTSELKDTCDKAGIDFMTSPYSFDLVDAVDKYLSAYKIGSGDASWLEIIDYVLEKGKPTLLATGACDLDDVKRMMELALSKTSDIVLMQCNTNYTGSIENSNYCNLNVLKTYNQMYPNTVLGLSDHTQGHTTVLGSIALGARVIEKHFTDNNNQEGPDHGFAMNPISWSEMVDRSYELLSALGDGTKRVEENEKQAYQVQRRCLRASSNLKKNHIITKSDLDPLRPIGDGAFQPFQENELIGKKLKRDVKYGEHFSINNIL